jgi:hypothetical protein
MATKLSDGSWMADDGATTGTRDEMHLRDSSNRLAARMIASSAIADMGANFAGLLLMIVIMAIVIYISIRMLWQYGVAIGITAVVFLTLPKPLRKKSPSFNRFWNVAGWYIAVFTGICSCVGVFAYDFFHLDKMPYQTETLSALPEGAAPVLYPFWAHLPDDGGLFYMSILLFILCVVAVVLGVKYLVSLFLGLTGALASEYKPVRIIMLAVMAAGLIGIVAGVLFAARVWHFHKVITALILLVLVLPSVLNMLKKFIPALGEHKKIVTAIPFVLLLAYCALNFQAISPFKTGEEGNLWTALNGIQKSGEEKGKKDDARKPGVYFSDFIGPLKLREVLQNEERMNRTVVTASDIGFPSPLTRGQPLETLEAGATVTVLGVTADRSSVKVRTADGKTGFVHWRAIPEEHLPPTKFSKVLKEINIY